MVLPTAVSQANSKYLQSNKTQEGYRGTVLSTLARKWAMVLPTADAQARILDFSGGFLSTQHPI